MMPLPPLAMALATIAAAFVVGLIVAYFAPPPRAVRRAAGEAPPADTTARPTSWLSGLEKTRGSLARRLLESLSGGGDGAALAEVEETLLASDVGAVATARLLQRWRRELGSAKSPAEVRDVVRSGVAALLADGAPSHQPGSGPLVILVVGVNGVGKTTTIGKLAHRYRKEGKKVLLVAADTFRAAAIEQLTLWAERVGADLVKHQHGSDPSAVVFDGVKAALARHADVVIVDTAGRLHVKENLMEEVKKISRAAARHIADAPHEVLLVIDATTGQNALNQARIFNEALGLTGVVLTKLDGTAKGGVALALRAELGLPLRYVGLGEKPEDLAVFDAEEFAAALFAEAD
jgi:fused signal recognition particle receptor